ncbi:NNMT/PNMT/TEMT family protein [Necator americanus]|uniref:NNMT/PNMT/TEMT family protein n=1 Tax=Necator americanus TaxID=51031 RepID=W2TAR9_NECAM|nr:NNMT/PNMT/TEMT family protein [Necator americanus]ETN79135.1 NNMT/PNMT/TEMT family protein [Necator americanus]
MLVCIPGNFPCQILENPPNKGYLFSTLEFRLDSLDVVYIISETHRRIVPRVLEPASAFDWSNVCRWISNIEASDDEPAVMQQKAREKVNAVLEVNVHETPVIRGIHWKREGTKIPEKFQIQGGVMDATSYNFGGKKFKCHCLKRIHIEESLRDNGMAISADDGYKFITHEDIFLLISRKMK